MKTIKENLDFFQRLLKAIGSTFGDQCEVLLHDYSLSEGYEKTIVAIENGHLTGRKVGDCGSNLGLEVLRGSVENGDKYNYITQSRDGKVFRSSSIYIRDEEQKPIGCLCINFNISDFLLAENTLKSITHHESSNEEEEFFANNVNDLLDHMLQEAIKQIGKPVNHMTREEKIAAIAYLDSKGAFLITKSGDKVCEFLGISKYTLYNYLDEVRRNSEAER